MSSKMSVTIYKAKRRHISEAALWMKLDTFLVAIEMGPSIIYPQKKVHVTCR
jgi:hypothetical protein